MNDTFSADIQELNIQLQVSFDVWEELVVHHKQEKSQGFTIFLPKNKKLSMGQNAQLKCTSHC